MIAATDSRIPVIVVMGVSGAGKTTLGRGLAQALDVPFQEGDDLHPAANIAKMHRGLPLDDADRAPWLDRVVEWIAAHARTGGVVSCSALKRDYRDRLRVADPRLRFVFLSVDAATLQRRVSGRRGHYMPSSLLQSQLETLQAPEGEADVLTVGSGGIDGNIAAALDWVGTAPR